MDKPFKDQTDIAAFNTQSTLEDLLTIKEFFHIFFFCTEFSCANVNYQNKQFKMRLQPKNCND